VNPAQIVALELSQANLAGRKLTRVRVTNDAPCGSPVAVPVSETPYSPLEVILHPDDFLDMALEAKRNSSPDESRCLDRRASETRICGLPVLGVGGVPLPPADA
jgi:hypothetical protein